MIRATNGSLLDANSQIAMSFVASPIINVGNPVLVSTGQGIFHGFVVNVQGTGSWTGTVYDSATTAVSGLTSATAVGTLLTTTTGGVLGFQWAGDVIFNNGLVVSTTGTTVGAIKVLYL